MAIAIGIVTFLILASLITFYGYRAYFRPGRVYERVQAEAPALAAPAALANSNEGLAVRIIRQIGEKVPVSPADAGMTRRYLLAAGFRSERSLAVYYGCKVLAAV